MRRIALLFALATPVLAQTPYGRLQFQLQSAQGQAIAGATVYVYPQSACGVAADTSNPATLYATATGTAQSQPVITDGFGQGYAYAAQGCYTVVYNSPYTGTITLVDQNAVAATNISPAGGPFCPLVGPCSISGTVTAPLFVGPLTGNVTGNLTGNVTGNLTGSVTGHASLDLPLAGGSLSGDVTSTATVSATNIGKYADPDYTIDSQNYTEIGGARSAQYGCLMFSDSNGAAAGLTDYTQGWTYKMSVDLNCPLPIVANSYLSRPLQTGWKAVNSGSVAESYGGDLAQDTIMRLVMNINPATSGNPTTFVDTGTNNASAGSVLTGDVNSFLSTMVGIDLWGATSTTDKFFFTDSTAFTVSSGAWTKYQPFLFLINHTTGASGYNVGDTFTLPNCTTPQLVTLVTGGGSFPYGFSFYQVDSGDGCTAGGTNNMVPTNVIGSGTGLLIDEWVAPTEIYRTSSAGAQLCTTRSIIANSQGDIGLLTMAGRHEGGTFQFTVDGVAATDTITGLTTLSSALLTASQPANIQNGETVQAAHFVVTPGVAHTYCLKQVSGTIAGLAMVQPPNRNYNGSSSPGVSHMGVKPKSIDSPGGTCSGVLCTTYYNGLSKQASGYAQAMGLGSKWIDPTGKFDAATDFLYNTTGLGTLNPHSGSAGSGFVTGDVVNIGSGGGQATVTAAAGAVTALAVVTNVGGTGYSVANNVTATASTGVGTGLTVDITVIGTSNDIRQNQARNFRPYVHMSSNGHLHEAAAFEHGAMAIPAGSGPSVPWVVGRRVAPNGDTGVGSDQVVYVGATYTTPTGLKDGQLILLSNVNAVPSVITGGGAAYFQDFAGNYNSTVTTYKIAANSAVLFQYIASTNSFRKLFSSLPYQVATINYNATGQASGKDQFGSCQTGGITVTTAAIASLVPGQQWTLKNRSGADCFFAVDSGETLDNAAAPATTTLHDGGSVTMTFRSTNDWQINSIYNPNSSTSILARGWCNGAATVNSPTIFLYGLGGSGTTNCTGTSSSFSNITVMPQNYILTEIQGWAVTAGNDPTSGTVQVKVYNSAGSLQTTLASACVFGTSKSCTGTLNYSGSKGDYLTTSFSTVAGDVIANVNISLGGLFR